MYMRSISCRGSIFSSPCLKSIYYMKSISAILTPSHNPLDLCLQLSVLWLSQARQSHCPKS